MNRLAILLTLGLISLPMNAIADQYEYALDVEGMVCAFCAYNVTKHLRSVEGVVPTSIEVDLEAGRVVLRSESAQQKAVLAEPIEAAGFELVAMTEKPLESSPPAGEPAKGTTLVSLEIDVQALTDGGMDALLEALGGVTAARSGRLTIAGPPALELPALQPLLMGRQTVIDVDYERLTPSADTVSVELVAAE